MKTGRFVTSNVDDYLEQARKAQAYDKFEAWLVDNSTPKQDDFGDITYMHTIRCDVLLKKLKEFKEDGQELQ